MKLNISMAIALCTGLILGDILFSETAAWDKNVVYVGGTAGDDMIFIEPEASSEEMRITIFTDGQFEEYVLPRSDIVVYGGSGDDLIYISPKLEGVSAEVYGGDGDDRIRGGSGDDILFGEDGEDFIIGHKGNDALIGGLGEDRLHGGVGHDLIVGGSGADEIHGDSGSDVLVAAITIYAESQEFHNLVSKWVAGTILTPPDPFLEAGVTVFDDQAADTLYCLQAENDIEGLVFADVNEDGDDDEIVSWSGLEPKIIDIGGLYLP